MRHQPALHRRAFLLVVGALLAAASVAGLARDADASRATLSAVPSDPSIKPEWQWVYTSTHLDSAFEGLSPTASPLVAVIDTGVAEAADLGDRLVAGQSFVGGPATEDLVGHGTAVAGIIGATAGNGVGIAGVCGACRILPLRVAGSEGYADSELVAKAVDAAVRKGAKIINLSLGSPLHLDVERKAIDRAVKAGVIVVAAAGNDSSSEATFPGAYAGVVGVAAVNQKGKPYPFSNHGPWVKVAAPGCVGAVGPDGSAGEFCGTSAAAPFVAGLAGLLLSVRPKATAGDVISAIEETARAGAGSAHGMVDAAAALRRITSATLGTKTTRTALLRLVRSPLIQGVGAVGSTLTLGTGTWSGPVTKIVVSWQRCGAKPCTTIATGRSTYVVRKADLGNGIRAIVKASGEDGIPVEAATKMLVVRAT